MEELLCGVALELPLPLLFIMLSEYVLYTFGLYKTCVKTKQPNPVICCIPFNTYASLGKMVGKKRLGFATMGTSILWTLLGVLYFAFIVPIAYDYFSINAALPQYIAGCTACLLCAFLAAFVCQLLLYASVSQAFGHGTFLGAMLILVPGITMTVIGCSKKFVLKKVDYA